MKRLVLNSGEAAILAAFGRDTVVSIPEIAVSTKMTPSQVREGVAYLHDKQFVRSLNNPDLVKLTATGSAAKHNLQNASVVFIED